jgi:hypothetical protein
VYSSLQTRDYSVDEKSDALFREFSRCDPVYDSPPERQHRLSRRLHQHRSSDFELHYLKRNRRISPPLSMDGDMLGAAAVSAPMPSPMEPLAHDATCKDIPIIRVADDDSSDCVY